MNNKYSSIFLVSLLIVILITNIPYNTIEEATAEEKRKNKEVDSAPQPPSGKKGLDRKNPQVGVQHDRFTLIDDEYRSGKIDLNKKIRYYAYGLFDMDKLDRKYHSYRVAKDITTVVLEMRNSLDRLKPDVKQELAEYGIKSESDRPSLLNDQAERVALFDHSNSSAGCAVFLTPPILDSFLDSTHFRLHYNTTGPHAVPLDDTNPPNGIPDYVEVIRDNLESSWMVNNANLWKSPRPDGTIGGGTDLIDIYLYDLVSIGFLGVAVIHSEDTSTPNPNDAIGYACLDKDLSSAPFDLREATTAHEFHHLVQFAYNGVIDTEESIWMFESMAQWFEDEVFDNNNDYVNVAPEFLSRPDLQLISAVGLREYGAGIWHRFVSDQYGDNVIKRTWERSASHQNGDGPRFRDNTRAIEEVTQTGAWREAYYSFAINNAWLGSFDVDRGSVFRAEEADLWPAVFDGQTLVYNGAPITITDNDATLQGGGTDYIFGTSNVAGLKITFDGEDSGRWLVTLALLKSGIPGTDLQVIDFILSPVTKIGSITVRNANTYGEIDVYIRNLDDPSSTVNRTWAVTYSPP